MAEGTIDANDAAEAAALRDAARAIERARLVQIGSFHFVLVMGALTLWGAAEAWAQTTGFRIAGFAALANALIAGTVIPSTLHEWGHFAGARLSGAVSPVLEEPRRHFFMFDFPMDKNDVRQFTWMSWGGILAPWGVLLAAVLFVPLATASAAVLFATLFARAVAVSVFEVPVVRGAALSGQPAAELGARLEAGGLDQGRRLGVVAGLACFALLWMAV
ncbi:MAG: hypothetical protein ACQGVK_23175 [Myxococcota bacterium]